MSDEQPTTEPMLSAIEARVLGTLMEKQLATPDNYPLTLNSLVLGCNQKTSREPTSDYSKGEVERCLNSLRERKLIEVEYGSRADRYDQRLSRKLHWDKPTQALFTIMLLRGPQTLNELLNRCEKLYCFDNNSAVQTQINALMEERTPLVVHLPRQAGQREDRYMHLLCGPVEAAAYAPSPTNRPSTDNSAELLARVEELEEKLERVMRELGMNTSEASHENG